MPIISHSDIKRFKRCRRKWSWQSRLGRNLEPKEVNTTFLLGSGVHHSLEMYYGEGEDLVHSFTHWMRDRWEEFKEDYELPQYKLDEIEEQVKLGQGMLEHYSKWAPKVDPDYFNEVVETELENTVDIPGTDGKFIYILDGLVKDEHGLYYVMEHKTASRMQTDHLDQDEQIVKYLWAAQQDLGVELAGVVYTILKKDVPEEPRELKDGSLSQAKSQKTTYEKYKHELEQRYDEIPEEFTGILEHLKQKTGEQNPYFYRSAITRSQEEIQEAGERLKAEYKDMTDDPRVYPNPTKQCSWDCSFQTACKLKSIGSDYEAELEHNFQERKRDD